MGVVLCGVRGRWRLAIRLAVAVVVVAAIAGVPGGRRHALADVAWCWDDPVVNIEGTLVSTRIGALADPETIAREVSEAIIVYTVPEGVHASVVSSHDPYFHERVVLKTEDGDWKAGKPIPVTVHVRFVARDVFVTQFVNTIGARVLSTSGGTTETGMRASFIVD